MWIWLCLHWWMGKERCQKQDWWFRTWPWVVTNCINYLEALPASVNVKSFIDVVTLTGFVCWDWCLKTTSKSSENLLVHTKFEPINSHFFTSHGNKIKLFQVSLVLFHPYLNSFFSRDSLKTWLSNHGLLWSLFNHYPWHKKQSTYWYWMSN